MSKVMVISDCHFGHKNILSFRDNFKTIEEHDNTIKSNILHNLGKRDSLWLLGDIFFTKEAFEGFCKDILPYVGYVNIVLGNHDTDNKERRSNVIEMCKLFDRVVALYNKSGFTYSHSPIHPDELRGKINIHGHVHTETIQDYNYFNASCENINYTPVDLQLIKDGYRGELFLK